MIKPRLYGTVNINCDYLYDENIKTMLNPFLYLNIQNIFFNDKLVHYNLITDRVTYMIYEKHNWANIENRL